MYKKKSEKCIRYCYNYDCGQLLTAVAIKQYILNDSLPLLTNIYTYYNFFFSIIFQFKTINYNIIALHLKLFK